MFIRKNQRGEQISKPLVSIFVARTENSDFYENAMSWLTRQDYDNIEIITDNLDLQSANGDYILVTDGQTCYEPNAVSMLVDAVQENNSDIVFFNMDVHWEHNSDKRISDSLNCAYIFSEYRINGQPVVNGDFFNGINPYPEACFIRRTFLVRNNIKFDNPKIFVRQMLMHNPSVWTLTHHLGHHIVGLTDGARNPADFMASVLDTYNLLRTYAGARFATRRWLPVIDQMILILSLDTAFGSMSKVVPMDMIPQCSIHLVDHCNLNCKSCSHFSCLARAGDFELKLSDFKRDIKRLRRITGGKIGILELYGGEPLLHPDVIPFMKYARRYFPRAMIRFITNGILLPHQKPEFWRAVHRYRVLISPTKYPIHVDWDRVAQLANQYKCALDFFGGTGYCQKTLYHKPLDLSGQQNGAISYINCQHTRCINLYQGRLYHCPIVAYIKYFNREFNKNLPVCRSDYLDIYQRSLRPRDVFAFCARPIPFCRFCMTQQTTRGHPWTITKKDISEWTL